MTKPRATWVLWVDVSDEQGKVMWEAAYEGKALASWANGKYMLKRFVEQCTGFGKWYRILPAGRKPK